jgi:hypothetical protein
VADDRTIRIATIAVWVLAAGVLVTLAFMRGTAPRLAPTAFAAGAHPIVYEFSTDS